MGLKARVESGLDSLEGSNKWVGQNGKKRWGSLKYNGLNGINVECQDRF